MKISVVKRRPLAGVATGARAGEYVPAKRDRTLSEFLVKLRIEFLPRYAASHVEVFGTGGQEKIDNVLEPILNRSEAPAIAATLTNIERCLAVVALRRIDRSQVG